MNLEEPGGPGAAAPSSPGGSGSHTLDSSSASASSAFPPPSSAHPSDAHSGAHRTLLPDEKETADIIMIMVSSRTWMFVLNEVLFNQNELQGITRF